jgi:hypothetical protein
MDWLCRVPARAKKTTVTAIVISALSARTPISMRRSRSVPSVGAPRWVDMAGFAPGLEVSRQLIAAVPW